MNLTELESLLSGIQSLILSIGILVGGVWSIFLFRLFNQSKRAELELLDIQQNIQRQELQSLEIQQNIQRQGVITLSIRAKQPKPFKNECGYYISVEVQISNIGSQSVVANYIEEGCLYAAEIITSENGNIENNWEKQYSPLAETSYSHVQACLFPAETVVEAFLICVPRPGAYLLSFKANITIADIKALSKETGMPHGGNTHWNTSKVIFVQE